MTVATVSFLTFVVAGFTQQLGIIASAAISWVLGIALLFSACKRVRDAAFFLIIMLVTFAATLLKPQKYVSSRTIQKCVEHVSTST